MRRELLVDQALTSERARLMQEMHDGIGSNLTTALAVARQQDQSDTTIDVLKRALGDLKLTVDSLEPIEGDLVALIGNLRHRMARDLAEAGITCKWEVEDCRPLPWLDATNALHVLRIHNEAISNILAHSNATEMRIGCYESAHNGVEGICTFVADNGDGFDVDHVTTGKGLNNINARAHSLHGTFFCRAQPGCGTTIRLWFPYVRSDAGPHECAE
jgi:signal transduction histidine kinase